MAFLSSAPSSVRRTSFRRKAVDWRVVGLTALSGVTFIAMLARPI